jgi:hypothetical protein
MSSVNWEVLMVDYPLEGGCFCGFVRYRLETPPMFVHCCHCTDCQKQAGSAFAINALIERDRITLLSGELEAIEMKTDSGRPHDIYRCPKCKSAVWSDYGRRRILAFVRVATLDTPSALVPDVHIFTRSKLDWVVLPEGARAFAEYYDMEKEWPAESLARRNALLGKGR